MPITTVSKLKAFMNLEAVDQTHDAELKRLIPAVQAFLEKKCERVFEKAECTEYYSGNDWVSRLIVQRPPIISIVNIWDDPLRVYAAPLATSLYAIEDDMCARAGVIRLDGYTFQLGIRNIKVTYEGGFASIPEDLEQAANEMVWAARSKGVDKLVGVRSRSLADGSTQWMSLEWDALAAAVVDKYNLKTGLA